MVNNHSYNGDKPTNFGIYVTLLQPCFNCTGRNGGFPWHWMGYISRLYVYIYDYIYITTSAFRIFFIFFVFGRFPPHYIPDSEVCIQYIWRYLKISRFWSVYPIYLKLSSIFIARCPRCQKLSIFIALIILTLGRGLKTFGCWIWLPVCIQG